MNKGPRPVWLIDLVVPLGLPRRLRDQADLAAALGDVRAVLGELGIAEDDLTTEQYTDAAMRPPLTTAKACFLLVFSAYLVAINPHSPAGRMVSGRRS